MFCPARFEPRVGTAAPRFSSHKYHVYPFSFPFFFHYPLPSICSPTPVGLARSDFDSHLNNARGCDDHSTDKICDSSLALLLAILLKFLLKTSSVMMTRTRLYEVMITHMSRFCWLSNPLLSRTSSLAQRLLLFHG